MEPPRQNREYYENQGLIYLDDEWAHLHFRIWNSSRDSNGFGVIIDTQVVFAYSDEYEMNRVEALEIVKLLQASVKEKKRG